MSIILRKVGGKFVPLFRGTGVRAGGSFVVAGGAGAMAFLCSPIVLAVLAVAFFVAWAIVHPHTAHLAAGKFALPVLGNVKIKELREKRATLVAQARTILDTADAAGRELTTEERTNYDKALSDQESLRTRIDTEERQVALDREMLETRGRNQPQPTDPAAPSAVDESIPAELRTSRWALPAYRTAYRSFLRGGVANLSASEQRDLDATNATGAAFLRAPIQMVQTLIKKVDDLVFIRGLATKFAVPQAASLGAPSLTSDPDEGDWTAELATGSNDAGMAFGRRELHPRPLAKRLKISNLLLRSAILDVESLVLDRLAYKRSISQEKAFLTGTGVNQPLGIFTVSTDGISAARDMATGNAATTIGFDGLINAKYAMKAQYWAKMRWLFHRDALNQISQLKDSQNRYLWEPSRQLGQPDMLLGLPLTMSEYAPNTFTTGKYVGALADFSWYWIADSLDLQIQRLVELYAETNQTGYITRQETDGMPVLEEAFVRVKLA